MGFSVSEGASVLVGVSLLVEAVAGGLEFEGPEEVVGFLEFGAAGGDFVDEVLDGGDAVLAEGVLDDLVVGDGNSLPVHFGIASLVDQLADGLSSGVSVGDIWFYLSDHVDGGLIQLHKGSVVELSDSQQLQDLSHSWVQSHDSTL